MKEIKKYNIPDVSSKIGICGIPIRCDTYSSCTFGCKYCFSNNREIMKQSGFKIADLDNLEKRLKRIFTDKIVDKNCLLDTLIADGITWHCGGLCDPFMPCEKEYRITSKLIDICNRYNISILFSTKSDTVYGADIKPELHSFQLSVSNIYDNKEWEPNVPSIESRYKFYRELKDKGFKVGIRVQPFIPNITTTDIIDKFSDADFFTFEAIKIVPQNKEYASEILSMLKMDKEDFKFTGLYNMRPEIKLEYYKPFIEKLNFYNIPYAIADNDLRSINKSKCCCGDVLIKKSTDFNTTAMLTKYGINYDIKNVCDELNQYGQCSCKGLFPSNRQRNVETVKDFFENNINKDKNPTGKNFQYIPQDAFYAKLVNVN